MAQKGDKFTPKFGPVVEFDKAPTQRVISFSEDTYQGRILRNWDDALGATPTDSILAGLRISAFGFPGLAPAAGSTSASLLQYIKQIEINLAGIKTDTAGIKVDTTALRGQLTALAASVTAIAASADAIAISSAAIAVSAAASAASSATIVTQQAQIIALLTSIDNKTI